VIHLLGCDHWLQDPEPTEPAKPGSSEAFWREIEWSPKARQQRKTFSDVIERMIVVENVDFIGEETKHDLNTPALRLASQYRRVYHNIDMPLEERRRDGIPDYYSDVPDQHTKEQIRVWHRAREEYMLRQVQEQRGNSTSLLIICGASHLFPLRDQFAALGELTSVEDITAKDWYLGRPSSGWL
jgi:hypothetical protein